MTVQVALWLSLLALLTALTLYESLHDRLPDGVLSVACIGYAAALLLVAATPEQLLHGFAAGGAGFVLGLIGAPLAAPAGRPGIMVVGAGWGFLASIVAFYFLVTNRNRELLHISFLPFLTLSAIVFF